MKTEMGEYIVGAYLKVIKECDFIDYNIRPPGGGLAGLNELDVIGLNFKNQTAYLCEVTTHISGLLYGSGNKSTVEKIIAKHQRQKAYAEKHLSNFSNIRYMFWSPVVSKGYITTELEKLTDLELIINHTYTSCINEMRRVAKATTNDWGNPFFRALQILEHLKT